jgi:ribosomal protein L29
MDAQYLQLSPEELARRAKALREELQRHRFQLAAHQLPDTSVYRRTKHELARIETLLHRPL